MKEEEEERQQEVKKKAKLDREAREDVKGFIEWCLENNIYKHSRFTDMNSASTTSTSFTPNRVGETTYRHLKEEEIRKKIYDQVKK